MPRHAINMIIFWYGDWLSASYLTDHVVDLGYYVRYKTNFWMEIKQFTFVY